MEIRTGQAYITKNSDLVMYIIKVRYVCDRYTKFKGILANKNNGIQYEVRNYKLTPEILKRWVKHKTE